MSRATPAGLSLGASAQARVQTTARRRAWRRNLTGYAFIAPWLLAFLSFTFLPIAASGVLAFTDYNVLSQTLHWIGLDNFDRMLFRDPRFWRAVRATLFYALTAVPLKLAFALALAMLLNNSRRFITGYRAAYYAPSIVGASVAVADVLREVFARGGPVNEVLAPLGIPARASAGDRARAPWMIILLEELEFGSPMLRFLED